MGISFGFAGGWRETGAEGGADLLLNIFMFLLSVELIRNPLSPDVGMPLYNSPVSQKYTQTALSDEQIPLEQQSFDF